VIYDSRGKLIKSTMPTIEEPQMPLTGGELGTDTQDNLSGSLSQIIIDSARIKDAAITTAKIDDAAITNAKIEDATIQSAKIDTLAASKITTGTLAVDVAITVNDGDDDRVLIGKF
jgi:hypothetical protein